MVTTDPATGGRREDPRRFFASAGGRPGGAALVAAAVALLAWWWREVDEAYLELSRPEMHRASDHDEQRAMLVHLLTLHESLPSVFGDGDGGGGSGAETASAASWRAAPAEDGQG